MEAENFAPVCRWQLIHEISVHFKYLMKAPLSLVYIVGTDVLLRERAEMGEVITETLCRKVLLKHNYKAILESYDIKPLVQKSTGGLMGLHYILRINYKNGDEKQTLQLFLKTLNNKSKILFGISQNLLFFEKEKGFFMEILPRYSPGLDIDFAPRAYVCEDNAVVLEDLTLSGFELFPKEKSMDFEHCYACLETIARFHASSMIQEILSSKWFGRKYSLLEDHAYILKDLICSGGDTDGAKYMEESVKGLLAVAELVFDDNSTLQELQSIFVSTDTSSYDDLRCVLLHGDLWNNNFLHKYNEENIIDSKLIDFQTIKYGPPCLDVLQFIYTNTRKALRKDLFNDFLRYYHEQLHSKLMEYGLELNEYFSKEQFIETCNIFKLKIKLQSVVDRCLTCIPDEFYEKITLDDEKFYDFLFVNRSKYLVDFFQNIPKYRELITEDLEELREMLQTKP